MKKKGREKKDVEESRMKKKRIKRRNGFPFVTQFKTKELKRHMKNSKQLQKNILFKYYLYH